MLLLSTDTSCHEQHEAIRSAAGWYYFTHHLVEVTGPDAAKLLDRVYVSNIGKLAPTRGRYTMMLTEEGIPQDDCVVFCLEENKYWVSTLHCPRTLKELENHKDGLDVSFRKITKEVDMYAVQGPKAADIVKSLVAEDVSGLKRFQIVDNRIGDVAVKMAKAGYTGENGYEIYCEVKDGAAIEAALEKAAPAFGGKKIDEFDVMAYTLATEAGVYLITDLDEATPFETGIDWTIDWSKEDFLGKAAAEKAKDLPKAQELVGITVDKEFTKVHGGPYGGCVSKNGKEIGRVTKFTYGFTAGKWVGFALVKAGSVQPGDHVTVDWDVDAVVTAERRFINT